MAEASSAPAEEIPKTKEKLEELTKAAALQYSLKNFSGAADHYADAVEIQAALNGEMAPENAELLFYYGRALYKVAISKSDVLGNKVAQEEKKKPKAGKKAKKQGAPTNGTIQEEPEENDNTTESKPYFQLTGTENWTDSEEEEDTEAGEGEVAEEEQDDFQDAYEIFELSRVLYSKQLEAQETGGSAGKGKGKGKGKTELSPPIRAIKEKLADCHGFLVEISLENERFHDAVADARQSLAFQEELNSFDHENVMEAHYSLSLALEFASNRVSEGQDGEVNKPANGEAPEEQSIDYELRKEAARHTELTIQSLEARIKREEAGLAGDTLTAEQKKEKKAIIKDKKEILEDMKTRLEDLNTDPAQQQVDSFDPSVLQGLLGGLLGADPATQKAKLKEATKSANDVSSLVRTKKKAPAPAPVTSASNVTGSSKRKLEDEDDGANGKRAKTEEIL